MQATCYARFAAVAVSASLLAGCSAYQPPVATVEKMYVYDCGSFDVDDLSAFTGQAQDKGKTKTLTVSCYLIQHRNGTLLWNTGLPDALAQLPGGTRVGPYTLHRTKTLLSQLQETGYSPDSIRYVGFSHMHPDHSGNGNAFAQSTILMQQEEYDAAFGPEPEKYRFNPQNYSQLKNAKVVKLTGDYDVFGDGSVVIKRTPGHTPGHQSLFVRLPQSGAILLSGDLVHFRDNWDNKRVPAFNFSREETLQSMAKMEAFMQQTGAKLLIEHDPDDYAKVPHAPVPYL
jgi:glyoxylase-like metal-dependent hydrolase (beta-lactamase superfamily II)